MQKLLTLIFFLLTIFNCYPQSKNKGYIALSIGPALPVGNFGSKDLNSNWSGFANIGEFANFSFSHLIVKHVGFSVIWHGQRNPLNTKSLAGEFSKHPIYQLQFVASDGTTPPPPSPPSYKYYKNWKFDKGSWLCGSLLIGGYSSFPVKKLTNLSFISKALIGVVFAKSPKLNGTSTSDTSSARAEQTSSSGSGFSYLISGGIKYDLKKICFLVNLDYLATNKIRFHDIKSTLTTVEDPNGLPSYQQSSVTTDGRQNIGTINLSIGIGLRL